MLRAGITVKGENVSRTLIVNRHKLGLLKEGKLCVKITNRNKWIIYLRKKLCSVNITETQKKKLIQWVRETMVTDAQVQALIDDNEWRTSDILVY